MTRKLIYINEEMHFNYALWALLSASPSEGRNPSRWRK